MGPGIHFGLAGRVAIICGATGGIGGGVARFFAAQGLRLVVTGQNSAKLARLAKDLTTGDGEAPLALAADSSDREGVRHLISTALKTMGQVDILFYNGFGPGAGDFLATSAEKYREAFEKTFLGLHYYLEALLPHFKKRRSGSVINLSSTVIRQVNNFYTTSSAIFGATSNLVRTLAPELAPFNININNILPVYTMTGLVKKQLKMMAKKNGTTPEVEERRISAEIPAGRLLTPEEIGAAALYLASPLARFVTGSSLSLDGGYIRSMDK